MLPGTVQKSPLILQYAYQQLHTTALQIHINVQTAIDLPGIPAVATFQHFHLFLDVFKGPDMLIIQMTFRAWQPNYANNHLFARKMSLQ